MLNKDFDPYAELLACTHNIQELIKAYNQQNTTIRELLEQNRKLNELLRYTRIEITKLNLDVQQLTREIKNSQ